MESIPRPIPFRAPPARPAAAGSPAPTPAPAESALIAAAQAGEHEALAALLARHQDRVYGICLRILGRQEAARDVAQDALIRIIEGLSTFDGRASFSTWMTRVTMNVCLSHARRERLRKHASLDGTAAGGRTGRVSGPASDGAGDDPGPWSARIRQTGEPEPTESVQSRERLDRLSDALARIDEDQRAILILRDVSGLDYGQIADALGVAVGTVKSRLFRARAALREAMGETADEGKRPG